MPGLNSRGGRGGGEKKLPPLPRFSDNVKTAERSAAKFSEPLKASIIHLVTKNEGQGHHRSDVSDVTVVTSLTK